MGVTFIVIKIVIIALIVSVPLVVLLVRRWRSGGILVPRTGLIIASGLLPIGYLLSALFAKNIDKAILGYDFNIDSFVLMLLGFMAMITTLLLSMRKSNADKIYNILKYVTIIAIAMFIAQVVMQLSGIELGTVLARWQLVDSWVSIAGLIGASVLAISYNNHKSHDDDPVSIKALLFSKLGLITILAMVFLGIVTNITNVFVLLLLLSIVALWHDGLLSKKTFNFKKLLVTLPAIVILFSMIFIIDTTVLRSRISMGLQSITGISLVDVRPNWQGTLDIATETISSASAEGKLFGPGVGSFSEQWRLHKPLASNSTRFWNTDFSTAVGFIPTSSITGGAVVASAWLLFFIALLLLFRKNPTAFGRTTLFLWLFALLNPIDILILVVAFVSTGLFIAEVARAKHIKVVKYSLPGEGLHKIVTLFLVPIVIFSGIVIIGFVAHRAMVNAYLQSASAALVAQDLGKAERTLSQMSQFSSLSAIEQGYTQIALQKFARLMQTQAQGGAGGAKVDQASLQAALSNIIEHARAAINNDPYNAANYITLGNIAEQVMQLGSKDSGETAIASYVQAQGLDPKNPAIPLAMARVHSAMGNKELALKSIEQSILLKGNFTPALYQYGLIKLQAGDATEALKAFALILQGDPSNANTLYYTAVALLKEGRTQDALTALQRVLELNPENKEIQTMINSIKNQAAQAQTQQATVKKLEIIK